MPLHVRYRPANEGPGKMHLVMHNPAIRLFSAVLTVAVMVGLVQPADGARRTAV